jgi:predicted Fe-S protein YdhL (DUF1289 family)
MAHTPDPEKPEPQSPCISVCALDDNDVCLGCYRSAEEITDWFLADAAGKREILRRARERRESVDQVRLG